MSCTTPYAPTTKTYEIDVAYRKQQNQFWCLPASVLMCSNYFAQDVGWFDEYLNELDEYHKQEYIYDALNDLDGTVFIPNSNEGAPKSISQFLFLSLNIENQEMAKLDTSYSCNDYAGSIPLIVEHIKTYKRPLIAIRNYDGEDKTHAIVVYGYQEDLTKQKVKNIYYQDPWYGGFLTCSSESWEQMTRLKDNCYLTLYFDDYE
ncbi:MAG: C39 family peptidase [Treponema sp.]|nr:C39 family peptidase [Treponema sp.]MBR4631176.1 C39 family peptidase [Treponema sp.]